MATASNTLNLGISTDAAFRAWASVISTRLGDMGLVKLVISGEIDMGTVTKPNPSTSNWPYDGFESKGFQIWRLDDALQAAYPVYLKIEYGGQQINTPWWTEYGAALRLTLGRGYSGTDLTNATASKVVYSYPHASTECRFSGSTSRFAALIGNIFFAFERIKDYAGNDTGIGASIIGDSYHAVDGSTVYGIDYKWQMTLLSSGSNPPTESRWGVLLPTTADGVINTESHGYTVHPFTPRQEHALLNALVFFTGNLVSGTEYDISVSGKSRHYLFVGEHNYITTIRPTEVSLAMRWE